MVIVGVRESEVESALEEGSGPELPDGARCPACGGELGRWGSYRRWARRREVGQPTLAAALEATIHGRPSPAALAASLTTAHALAG